MSKKNCSNILSASARTALAFVFVLGQTAWAGQAPSAKYKPTSDVAAKTPPNVSPASSKARPAEEESPTAGTSSTKEDSRRGGGQHEGIKVHGHWTIEVRNPDGSLVNHREFENSLAPVSAGGLAVILSRQFSVGAWILILTDDASATPDLCQPSFRSPGGECRIAENSPTVLGNSSNLTVGASGQTATTAYPVILNLSGSVSVPNAGSIDSVESVFETCAATVSPSACFTGSNSIIQSAAFTVASLGTPVSVAAGQTVAVTVVISFS